MHIAAVNQPADADGRKRPKNRKAQLALAAAELFCERGYHGVSLGDIATVVGISGPAVYRHFPNKYAILVFATRQLVEAALAATDEPEGPGFSAPSVGSGAGGSAAPEGRLDALLGALARLAVDCRRASGLYQWEWRYLADEHRREFESDLGVLVQRVARRLTAVRTELAEADANALVRAALSVFGSLGTHRAAIAKGRAEQALRRLAWAVLRGEPPTPAALPPDPVPDRHPVRVAARREVLLAESIRLFRRYGYHAVSIEDIGRAAGINASSVYRYFPGKADILAAAFYRASERVTEATAAALAGAADADDALLRMSESYVDLTFERSDLVSVYLAENNNLPEADRHELRKVQRLHVEEWVRLLGAVRPELPNPEARLLVHAALNLVTDLSRWVRFDRRSGMDRHLVRLVRTVLAA